MRTRIGTVITVKRSEIIQCKKCQINFNSKMYTRRAISVSLFLFEVIYCSFDDTKKNPRINFSPYHSLQNAEKIESIEGVFKEEMHFKDLNFRAL